MLDTSLSLILCFVPFLKDGSKQSFLHLITLWSFILPPGELPRCIIMSAHSTVGNSQLTPFGIFLLFSAQEEQETSWWQIHAHTNATGHLPHSPSPTMTREYIGKYYFAFLSLALCWIFKPPLTHSYKNRTNCLWAFKLPKEESALCCCLNQFSSIIFSQEVEEVN